MSAACPCGCTCSSAQVSDHPLHTCCLGWQTQGVQHAPTPLPLPQGAPALAIEPQHSASAAQIPPFSLHSLHSRHHSPRRCWAARGWPRLGRGPCPSCAQVQCGVGAPTLMGESTHAQVLRCQVVLRGAWTALACACKTPRQSFHRAGRSRHHVCAI